MDKVNPSAPSRYLDSLKSALHYAHNKLDSLFSWPVPYWLSPFGIFIMWAAWEGLNWKVNSDNWPIWVWFLDKSITIGAIFGAALLAQKIFNDNARIRENRERRLKRVEKSIEIADNLRTKAGVYLNSDFESYTENYTDLMNSIVSIRTFSNVYFKNQTNINDIYKATSKIHIKKTMSISKADFVKPSSIQKEIIRKSNPELEGDGDGDGDERIGKLIQRLITSLVKVHKEIENEH